MPTEQIKKLEEEYETAKASAQEKSTQLIETGRQFEAVDAQLRILRDPNTLHKAKETDSKNEQELERKMDKLITQIGSLGAELKAKKLEVAEKMSSMNEAIDALAKNGSENKVEKSPLPATEINHYETLGVQQNATDREITKAYHALAKRYHPDRNKTDTDAPEKFNSIQEAYNALIKNKSEKKVEKSPLLAIEAAPVPVPVPQAEKADASDGQESKAAPKKEIKPFKNMKTEIKPGQSWAEMVSNQADAMGGALFNVANNTVLLGARKFNNDIITPNITKPIYDKMKPVYDTAMTPYRAISQMASNLYEAAKGKQANRAENKAPEQEQENRKSPTNP